MKIAQRVSMYTIDPLVFKRVSTRTPEELERLWREDPDFWIPYSTCLNAIALYSISIKQTLQSWRSDSPWMYVVAITTGEEQSNVPLTDDEGELIVFFSLGEAEQAANEEHVRRIRTMLTECGHYMTFSEKGNT